jgi:uroporphyrinogen III methyltransferase/synthase
VDIITFTSASTVRNFLERIPVEAIREAGRPVRVATIGPETSAACRSYGLQVHVEAHPHTIDGLLSAL